MDRGGYRLELRMCSSGFHWRSCLGLPKQWEPSPSIRLISVSLQKEEDPLGQHPSEIGSDVQIKDRHRGGRKSESTKLELARERKRLNGDRKIASGFGFTQPEFFSTGQGKLK